MKKNSLYSWFRKIAMTEGISFLVLLFIAMPMKYMAGMPLAVTIIGGIHGALFVLFIIMAWLVKNEYQRDFLWIVKAFVASIIPFGTFIMDKEWKKEEMPLQSKNNA
jgi:integral membrane protein